MGGITDWFASLALGAPRLVAWLAGGFGAALILLYLLRLRRAPVSVSSVMLWRQALEDFRANHPFQKLRLNVLLLLQALTLLTAAAAVGELVARGKASGRRAIILIIDRSASMSAREADGRTRLEIAREKAREVVDGMGGGDTAMVVAFAADTEVLCAFTPVAADIRAALDRVRPSDAPTDPSEALRIASAAHRAGAGVTAIMFTDGRYEARFARAFTAKAKEGGLRQNLDLTYVRVGETTGNWGIVTFDVRPIFRAGAPRPEVEGGPPAAANDGYRVLAEVKNFSDSRAKRTVSLYHDGKYRRSVSVDLGPDRAQQTVFSLPERAAGVVAVRIDGEDALAADDEARAVLAPPRPRRVLLATPGNYYLASALEADPDVELTTKAPSELAAMITAGEFDPEAWTCVCLDRAIPDAWRPGGLRGNYLTFGLVPPVDGYKQEGRDATSRVIDWHAAHPINRYLNYADVNIASRPAVATPKSAVTLLESNDGPLITLFQGAEINLVAAHFSLLKSDWALKRSFPIFLHNAVEWFEEARGKSGGRFTRTGAAAKFEAGTDHQAGETITASWTGPGGGQEGEPRRETGVVSFRLAAGRRQTFAATDRAGLYAFEIDGGRQTLAVNLLDEVESNIAPRQELVYAQDEKPVRAGEIAKSDRDLWPWLAGIALSLVMAEWWLYHRRTLG
ncbi:MAG: VWA domain-containing protein [Planctomycetes bacterium]|nr:VWA domain-containing protein [Planctomycetota bacterium]